MHEFDTNKVIADDDDDIFGSNDGFVPLTSGSVDSSNLDDFEFFDGPDEFSDESDEFLGFDFKDADKEFQGEAQDQIYEDNDADEEFNDSDDEFGDSGIFGDSVEFFDDEQFFDDGEFDRLDAFTNKLSTGKLEDLDIFDDGV